MESDLVPTNSGDRHQAGLASPNGWGIEGDASTGCVWFSGVGDASVTVSPVWPPGFTVTFDPLRVYDNGELFATEGDVITGLGGSEAPADPGGPCHKQGSMLTWDVCCVEIAPT